MVSAMRYRIALLIAGSFLLGHSSWAQDCPTENFNGSSSKSASRSLTGLLVYHDGLEPWIGLKLDQPVCETQEILLRDFGHAVAVDNSERRRLSVYRDCRITVYGPLDDASNGYAEISQDVERMHAGPDCTLKPAFLDYSQAKPDRSVRRYDVVMAIDYSEVDGHVSAEVTNSNSKLQPWQAYAPYLLTGGLVFDANCAEGYKMSNVGGTPDAHPEGDLIPNTASFDPQKLAVKNGPHIQLSFTCRR